jgi:hypothetical protein
MCGIGCRIDSVGVRSRSRIGDGEVAVVRLMMRWVTMMGEVEFG